MVEGRLDGLGEKKGAKRDQGLLLVNRRLRAGRWMLVYDTSKNKYVGNSCASIIPTILAYWL